MPHNKERINTNRLFNLIKSISSFVDREIFFYALGGTALTLLNIKNSTLDVDINIESEKDYLYVCELFDQIGFKKSGPIRWISQEGIAFDIFHGSYILGTDLLHDCLNKSKFIESFGKIKLYALNPLDIIISKLARGDDRDFEDIKSIFKSEKIDLKELVDRYKKTMETSIVSNSKQKLLDLIEIKFSEWEYDLDAKLIGEVKKWDN
ncbi:hypothetical protein HOK51_08650 [Candidatus Woesearchaeota archaeon]|jgi:hypothetical protein|nr:hypothetical protein [Candidatus Woesearchaeota archaeon]MBT6519896.1 hypothetical protein [Candidatus Woesearchaeota archaeon]